MQLLTTVPALLPPQTPQLQSFRGFLPNELVPFTHLAVMEAGSGALCGAPSRAGGVGAWPEQSEEQLDMGRDTHRHCQLGTWRGWNC